MRLVSGLTTYLEYERDGRGTPRKLTSATRRPDNATGTIESTQGHRSHHEEQPQELSEAASYPERCGIRSESVTSAA
jgi:hypothetical protein